MVRRRSTVRFRKGALTGDHRRVLTVPLQGSPRRSVRVLVGQHWLFLVLLAAGAVLRVLTMLAMRPALLATDSSGYLATADRLRPGLTRPSGYPALLTLLPYRHHLVVIPLAQHVLGLVVAVMLYVLVLRLVRRPWVAALAAAPLLLDVLMLDLEQYVMSDAVFAFELFVACALLVVVRRPRARGAASLGAAAGLIFGLSAITRTVGAPVAIVAALVVAVGWARPRVRTGVIGAAAVLAGFAAVYGAYLAGFHHVYGTYSTSASSGRFLYARVAPWVDCRRLTLPSYERPLCEDVPPSRRFGVDWYMWNPDSPAWRITPPSGMTADHVYGDFARRAIRAEPVTYARTVALSVGWSFMPVRIIRRGDDSLSPWQFRTDLPRSPIIDSAYHRYGSPGLRLDRPLVKILSEYGHVGYTPGPLLALGLIAPLVAVAGAGRARTSGLRMPAVLFGAVGAAALLAAFAGTAFDWRYALPQLMLLAPAAAIGLTAVLGLPTTGAVPVPASGPPAAAGDDAPGLAARAM